MRDAHTPAPWHVSNGVQIRSEHHQIAKVWMMRSGEGNANARLIAASPAMLKALQAILEEAGPQFGHDDGPGCINRIARFARLAIAEASPIKENTDA